jgi:hypothetical protein
MTRRTVSPSFIAIRRPKRDSPYEPSWESIK